MSDGMKRRDFLKVLGATGAGAATAGCSTGEVERLIPYVVPAEEIVPGVPTWYATTCRECPAGCGLHVETHSGRATKVEGNPDHPVSRGNTCARGQSSVQGLYHPDRWKGPLTNEAGVRTTDVTWSVAERLLAERIRELRDAGRGDRIVFLTQDYTGTMERLVNDWVAAVGARRVIYDNWADQPRNLDFAQADFLISFGADFLETWGSPVEYSWQYAQMRDHRIGGRGKFVWVGPHRPLTGLNADEWIAPRPGTEHILALALGGRVDAATAAQQTEIPQETIERLADEFRTGRGVAMGPGAAILGNNYGQLRDAIDQLNGGARQLPRPELEQSGRSIVQLVEQMKAGQVELLMIDAPDPAYTLPGALDFAAALELVPYKVSFSTFPDATSVLCDLVLPEHHFLERWDDYVPSPGVYDLVQPTMRPVFNTKQAGDVLLSVASLLGIESVSAGITANTYYDYLRSNWASVAGGADGWRAAVKRGGVFPGGERAGVPAETGLEGGPGTGAAGFVPLTAGTPGAGETTPEATATRIRSNVATAGQAPVAPQADVERRSAAPTPAGLRGAEPLVFEGDEAGLHLIVYPSYRFYDGRTANRPWLLELPDPVTKVSWESWVEIHPRTAEELGIEQGDWVRVASPYGSVETLAYVWPGVRPDAVAIQAGLGHAAMGRWTEGRGVNPNRLLGPTLGETGRLSTYGLRVSLERLAEDFRPAAQGLFEGGVRIQGDREIAQAVSLATLAEREERGHPVIPGEAEHIEVLKAYGGFIPAETETDPSAYPGPGTHYGEYVEGATRWAMAIDLNRCIGCSACVVACYAENNIPVVGPDEVRRGRELSWLRIERYFKVGRDAETANEDNATEDVRFLPMLCQHCGNAPCEPVCPVYAAYHTPDGLNAQVYNRCVGTRYCANNCPYKVRYFNWWTYEFETPLNWQLNPDVAVREKGVMEKCTFCVQRIREAEYVAAHENRPVREGEVVPACVQTCPTEVFVFGNISDPNSEVARAARSVRGYRALEILNTQPAIVYLKKVTLHEPEHGGHHAVEVPEAADAPGAAH